MSNATTGGVKRLALPHCLDPELHDVARAPIVVQSVLNEAISTSARRLAVAEAEIASLRTSLADANQMNASLRTSLAEMERIREAMAATEDRIDLVLAGLLASRSWRITRPLRRVLGIDIRLDVYDGAGPERLMAKFQLCFAILGSVWWDLAMPLRGLLRARNVMRRILGQR